MKDSLSFGLYSYNASVSPAAIAKHATGICIHSVPLSIGCGHCGRLES